AAARRAEPAPLTGKRDQNLPLAVCATKAGEPLRQDATGQKLAQLALDEPRQTLPTTAQPRLGQKGFEVLANHLVEDGVLGLAADVGGTCHPKPVRTSWWPRRLAV